MTLLLSSPLAGQKPVNGVVLWHQNHESILHHVKHKANEGKLIIEQEGYYSVYSKINFMEDNIIFSHSVHQETQLYPGNALLLLESFRSHPKFQRLKTDIRYIIDNSYLSGVFHLYKGDAVFVRVKNCTLVLSNSAENYFGVFMV